MNACDWIICERTGRWAAALRVGAARRSSLIPWPPRFFEVRSLDELADRLAARPLSLALLEVQASNLGKVLPWLAHNAQRFPQARFVALFDRMLTARAEAGIDRSSVEAQDLIAALLEAGATEIAPSPRRLQHIFALADTHAISVRTLSKQSINLSIADWAWSQLPWQTDRIRS